MQAVMTEVRHIKKFYCVTHEICQYKNHYVNPRCWAPYLIRNTCPSLANKQQAELLSREGIDG